MPQTTEENRYSLWVGLIFIFNVIVGTGALTLPAAFAKAGWLLGTVSIVFLAFVSYVTATYVIESMACANAVIKWRNLEISSAPNSVRDDSDSDSSDEQAPMHRQSSNSDDRLLVPFSNRFYSLDSRVELGEMATLFFNPIEKALFYITMIVYLFGDLTIYSTAISKTAMDVICSYGSDNFTKASLPGDLPCFNSTTTETRVFTRLDCYRIVLTCFALMLGPLVFFNVQKTKHLQIFTSIMRWLAFGIMITLAIIMLIKGGVKGNPPVFDMTGVPALFGACIYSFMCHHSLPGMVAPIVNKTRLWPTLLLDFMIIAGFYLLLALTGIFAFTNLQDLYTLNFIPKGGSEGTFLKIIEYFLALFPVFTLSTTFPVMAITLRNNIQSMFLDMTRIQSYNLFLRRLLFPVIVLIPPVIITMFFEDVTMLVSFTGSFAGTGIQYVIPTYLVLAARKECSKIFPNNFFNEYQSPFKHMIWPFFIFSWAIICIVMVSLNLFKKKFSVYAFYFNQ